MKNQKLASKLVYTDDMYWDKFNNCWVKDYGKMFLLCGIEKGMFIVSVKYPRYCILDKLNAICYDPLHDNSLPFTSDTWHVSFTMSDPDLKDRLLCIDDIKDVLVHAYD